MNAENKLPLTLLGDRILVGRHTEISFNRTLRVPDDGKRYNLPAGFGRIPIVRVEDVADRVPKKWKDEGGLIIPLYQREALFLEFKGADWRPTIAKVAVGRVNAITGGSHDFQLKAGRQDYVVIPEQRWLDGINTGKGTVRQFVAMPLGQGYTIEAQVTDEEVNGGFQFALYDPKPGFFSEPKAPEWIGSTHAVLYARSRPPVLKSQSVWESPAPAMGDYPPNHKPFEMGIAAGGSIKQQILEDEYGIQTWDLCSGLALNIHIVNSDVYTQITGQPAPPTPVTMKHYVAVGIPWYEHYDESRREVASPKVLQRILSIFQIDRSRGKVDREQSEQLGGIPTVTVKTLTLSERINALYFEAQHHYREMRFQEAMRTARICGELLERHATELRSDSSNKTARQLASEVFRLGGECALNIRYYEDAEDFANRSLNLEFSEPGLTIRMYSRYAMARNSDALCDCEELLSRNPSHQLAKDIQSQLMQSGS